MPHPPRPPPHIPDHELLAVIGNGAYGEVWLARNVVGTLRAVKVVYRRDFCEVYPFEREFKGLQHFEPVSRSHESLMDILQIGRNDEAGYFYCVMELADDASERWPAEVRSAGFSRSEEALEGHAHHPDHLKQGLQTYVPRTLRHDLKQRGRLPASECVRLGLALSSGLDHLHRNGLVHRDIKPSNIIFVGGVPKLADIGLVADMNEARSFVGTTGYIAPEGPGTAKADVYSLGKMLYEMATGQDRSRYPDLPADLKDWPDAHEVLELNQIILKACEDEPGRRYSSAGRMHEDLALLERGRSVQRRRHAASALKVAAQWALVLAVGVAGVWTAVSWAERKPPPPATVATERASIFVLPFRFARTADANADLPHRVTDAFIDSLGLIKGVRVGPRKSGWVCRDEAELRELVRTNYNMRHVLTGTVSNLPGQLKLELTFYQTEGDKVLWSETMVGITNDVIAMEQRALARIATTLGLNITGEEHRQINQKLTNNLEAFRLVNQIHGMWNQANREVLNKILNTLYRALELDPLYLDAQDFAAYMHRHLAGDRQPSETWNILRTRARQVLEVDDTHYRARYSRWAVTHMYDWDWAKADALYAELLTERPDVTDTAYCLLGHYHMNLGWFDIAEAEWRKALAADPKILEDLAIWQEWLAFLVVRRRYEEGYRTAVEGIKLFPSSATPLAFASVHAVCLRDYGAGLNYMRMAMEIEAGPWNYAQLGSTYARMGDRAKALEMLHKLEMMSKERYVQPYFIAAVHASLGDKDKAFEWLNKAVEDRCEELVYIASGSLMGDPAWDELRDDPRFFELRKKVGFDIWPKPTCTIPEEFIGYTK
jgi:TolB-like protein